LDNERFGHIYIDTVESLKYKGRGQGGANYPIRNRIKHSEKLLKQFDNLWDESTETSKAAVSAVTKDGVYVEFHNSPGYDLKVESLESRKDGIRLLNIREKIVDDKIEKFATVYIPKDKRHFFLKKIESYMNEDTPKGKPKNAPLIDGIEDITNAILESFWSINEIKWIPNTDKAWCEIWLSSDSDAVYEDFIYITKTILGLEIKDNSIVFPERRVVLINADREGLQSLLSLCNDIAEMRRASEAISFFVDIENSEQIEWATDVLDRLEVSADTNVYISILDTGVNNGHILLNPVLSDEDCKSFNPSWTVSDLAGHGTNMSGVVAYGELKEALMGRDNIKINHRLESLKIIPDKGHNPPELYGDITGQIISNAIIDNPNRQRIICMAVTAPNYQSDDGRPSSWSASIDELTSGYIDDIRKLFIISAGNNEISNESEYPDSNYTSIVQNPGQSWNALTVGAYTDLHEPYGTYLPLAPKGGLSPYSTTSYAWDKSKWPIKPDVVLEGGNMVVDSFGTWSDENHSVLTTSHKLQSEQFSVFNATSAATAKAAWMAALIQGKYPQAWPETIRGILVHSAEWTEGLKKQFLSGSEKRHYHELIRMCGYGVPNLDIALNCLKNNVSMVMQSTIVPFNKNKNGVSLNEMHLYELPWPKEVLLSLGELNVKLKVTLSYFIEPSPGEVGWKSRYSYSSCGLRFDINGSATQEQFIKRINQAAREEDEGKSQPSSINWTIGPNARNKGSIHSDIWETTASELATSNIIGVYPISGWWSKRPWLNRWSKEIRYSLMVTLSTPATNVDLYTPIENIIINKIENQI